MSAVPSGNPSAREVIEALHALRQAPVDAAWWPLLAGNLQRLCRANAVWLLQEADGRLQPLAQAGSAAAVDDPLREAWQDELRTLLGRAGSQGYATCPGRSAAGAAGWWAAVRMERQAGGWILLNLPDAERAQINELLLRAQLVADLPGPSPDHTPAAEPAPGTALSPLAATNGADLPQTWHRLADVAAQVTVQTAFGPAALALVNGLAARCEAQQVVLGWRAGPGARPEVVAISHRDKFDRGSAPIARTEDALDEALDHAGGVWLPAPRGQPVINDTPAHALLQEELGRPLHLLSLPLAQADSAPRAVLLLAFETPPSPLLRSLLPASLQQLLPTLELLHDRERAWPLRMKDRALVHLQGWLGPGRTGWKASAGIGALLLLYTLLAHWDYRVNATGQIVTDSTRVLSAQFDGRVEEARAKAGDVVRSGDVLARLDTRELRQQEVDAGAELKRYVAEADKARAANALAELEVASARAAQAQARLSRVLELINQAQATAPFDGVVVEGERQELQGAPVRKGDKLYRLARIEGLYATLVVPERDAALVAPGASGELVLVSRPGQKIPLRVTAVIPVAQTRGSEGNQFLVRAELQQAPEAWWRPGMSGAARIDAGERQVAWILTHRLLDTLRLWLWW
ncbi:MAG: efflux RND transporter periplasmic adaptor subunit [Rubrivivax sp.]|nr:efflux RND transporter periplasmic adaptor subunit [Rubrivivax sp.]